MAFVPGSPVCAPNSARLEAMTNGRFGTLGNLEVEYGYYLLKERIFRIHGGNLAQNLASLFVNRRSSIVLRVTCQLKRISSLEIRWNWSR